MATTLTIQGPKLYPKQHAAIFDPARHCFIEASTKAGKTLGCIIWQFDQCCKKKGHHWWVAPIRKTARIAYERAKNLLPKNVIIATNETEQTIKLINGSTWAFLSGEKPDGLYGEDVQSVVIDEASRCRQAVWDAIRSTLTATRGKTRVIGNVKGRKNWFYKLARRAEYGAEGYAFHKLTAYDAVEGGVLDIREIEEAERDLPPHVFAELYKAEASEDGANPFGITNIDACVGALAPGPALVWGIDLAKSTDFTCLVGLNKDGDVCAFEHFQQGWRITVNLIRSIVGDADALVDSTGVGDPVLEFIDEENFEGFVFTSKSKQQLMEGLSLDFGQRAFCVGPDEGINSILIEELKSFEFEHRRTGVRYSAPDGLHDDAVCALALARRKYKEMQYSTWW